MRNINRLVCSVGALLLAGSDAFAQQGGAPQAQNGQMFMHTIVMLSIVFLIFYFLVFSPQQKKLKAQMTLLEGLKKGDGVVTSSGLIGKVAGVEKDHILLEVANNVRIRVERLHVVKREEKREEKSAA